MQTNELAKELNEIYNSIKVNLDRSSMDTLYDELDYRCGWLARSAEILSDAQEIYDKARGEESEKVVDRKLSPSVQKIIVDANCSTQNKLLTLAERLNSTLTHQIDAIRSILSAMKEDRKQSYGVKQK